MIIKTAQTGVTADYTVSELMHYLSMLDPDMPVNISKADIASADKTEPVITLGLLDELHLPTDDLNDPFIEDIIDINIENSCGYIAGSNLSSVLAGVYRFLQSAGCRWVRPGIDGEYIPRHDMTSHSFRYRKKADYLFRGECSEGASSYEHMRDMVLWMPKAGYNMYMIEGLVPYIYMHKWYGHVANTRLRQKGQVTDYAMLEGYIEKLEQDILKTGMQLHTIGHGWMFENLGLHHLSPAEEQKQLREEDKQYLALVNGKRDLMYGTTFYTHFCYSNPQARKLLVDFWVDYAKKKPFVDYMHIWLADATNNQCECENCRKMTPSDFYVMLLNEIDEALERENVPSRMTFIMYVDTVFPPQKLKLRHPERFMLLAAIGGGFYEHGYITEKYKGEIPPYERNNFQPKTNALQMLCFNKWKEVCGNIPSCIYEYRFYIDQYCDPGHMQISRETNRGMIELGEMNFDGCMSDQTMRNFMPTGLPMITMGMTLFDKNIDFDALYKDYFKSAFGEEGEAAAQYLEKLSVLFCPNSLRRGRATGYEEAGLETANKGAASWENNPQVAASLAKIPETVDSFRSVIERNMSLENVCHAASWKYLNYHAEIVTRLSRAYYEGACGDIEKARELYTQLLDYISEIELEIHTVFDLFLFNHFQNIKFGIKFQEYFD